MSDHHEQLAAVEAAIAKDPGNEEWQRLRADLLEVIQLKQQLSAVTGGGEAAAAMASSAAASELRSYSIGDKCQAVFEQDGQWYNAKIVALAADGYFVAYLGYGNTAQVDFAELRPYVRPDTSEWRTGIDVLAIAPSDGRWYEARIVAVKQAVATVRFVGESDVSEVELDAVRLPKKEASAQPTTTDEPKDDAAAKLPKQMEVRPDDSEEVVARKKRKLNMYRRQEKKEKEEKHGDDRRSSWQNFSKKNKTVNKVKNNHDPNWDPTRDRGEIAARERIERGFGPI